MLVPQQVSTTIEFRTDVLIDEGTSEFTINRRKSRSTQEPTFGVKGTPGTGLQRESRNGEPGEVSECYTVGSK